MVARRRAGRATADGAAAADGERERGGEGESEGGRKKQAAAVRAMVVAAWRARIPCVAWARQAQAAVGDGKRCTFTADALSQFFYEEMTRSRLCSKVLLAYLHQALACRLVPPETFVRLCVAKNSTKAHPTLSTSLFLVFLELLDKFWSSFAFDKANDDVAIVLETAAFLMQSILRTTQLYTSGEAECPVRELQAHTHNALYALRVLTEFASDDRSAALLLLAKALNPGLWEQFYANASQVHTLIFELLEEKQKQKRGTADVEMLDLGASVKQLTVATLSRSAFAELMLEQWIPFCDAIDCVVDVHCAVNDPRPGFFPAMSFMHVAAERVNVADQWSVMELFLQMEVVSNTLVSAEQSLERLKLLREFYRNESDASFCSLLFAACLKAESMALCTKEESQWGLYRGLLLNRIPAFLQVLFSNPQVTPFYRLEAQTDAWPVEASLIHISRFSSLIQREIQKENYEKFRYLIPEARYDMFSALIRACIERGLVRAEYLQQKLSMASSLQFSSSQSVSVTVLLANTNASASSSREIDELEAYLFEAMVSLEGNDSEQAEAALVAAFRCLLNTVRHAQAYQDRTVRLLVSLMDPEKMTEPHHLRAVSLLCSMLSSDQFHRLFNVFCLHGQAALLIERLVHFCQCTGSVTTVGGTPARDVFSPIFVAFVHAVEKYSVRTNESNQRVVGKLFARYEKGSWCFQQLLQSFDCTGTLSEETKSLVDLVFTAPAVNVLELERRLLALTPLHVLEIIPRVVVEGLRVQTNLEELKQRIACFFPVYKCVCLRVFNVLGQEQFIEHLPLPIKQNRQLDFQVAVLSPLLSRDPQRPDDEVTVALKLIITDRFVASKQTKAHDASMSSTPYAIEVVGPTSFTDFLSTNCFDVNCMFQSLLGGSSTLRQSRLHQLSEIAARLSKRAFVETVLKEYRVLCSPHAVGAGAITSLRAAQLGGCIIGIQGVSYVAELILNCLPNTLPSLVNVAQAQTTAHFVWTACIMSNFLGASDLPTMEALKVARARNFFWSFIADLLERLLIAPAPLLALPVTLLALISNHPSALDSARVTRIANALAKFGYRRLCMALLDPARESTRDHFLQLCCASSIRKYDVE